MNSIIDDLYLGNINPGEFTRIKHAEYRRLQKKLAGLEERLTESLPPEQKKLFEEFVDADCSASDIEVRARFADGFRLGAKLMLDVLAGVELEQ